MSAFQERIKQHDLHLSHVFCSLILSLRQNGVCSGAFCFGRVCHLICFIYKLSLFILDRSVLCIWGTGGEICDASSGL